ncbi:ferritin [Nocardia wallacei]|uniref:Ferritin n=1 Tax=Nocardia wallacei TaxID=480035 RepID=A0A7G1KAV2_9NOCA|nr:ferritin-like domain-containing protein [Nocardia wallacei]BCK52308.1 ferritin [Nocardia wallacei]
MPSDGHTPDDERPFPDLLHDQIRHEFTAAQQYLAAAVYLDTLRLPRLAGVCYRRAADKHAHALRMIQYLLDRAHPVRVGGLDEIVPVFESARAAIEFMLRREEWLTERVNVLTRTAWETGDYVGEQFIRWFLRDQLDEVARITTLLAVCDRAQGNMFDVEEFVVRELRISAKPDPAAPKMAGTSGN